MAETTIVNTPATGDGGMVGTLFAIIIILALAAGGFVWYRYYGGRMAPAAAGTNINVTIPAPTGNSTGSGNGY